MPRADVCRACQAVSLLQAMPQAAKLARRAPQPATGSAMSKEDTRAYDCEQDDRGGRPLMQDGMCSKKQELHRQHVFQAW